MISNEYQDFRYKWNDLHKSVITKYIELLKVKRIRFFILRNYIELPEHNRSKDIDIIIDPKFYNEAISLLLLTYAEYNFNNCYIQNYNAVKCTFAMNLEYRTAIEIDLLKGCNIKGFELFSFEYLYNKSVPYKQFFVLPENIEVVLLFVYKIIGWKKIKESYKNEIEKVIKSDSELIRQYFSSCFGDKNTVKVIEYLKQGDYSKILAISKTITFSYRFRIFYHKPLVTIRNFTLFFLGKVKRILFHSRLHKLIAVEGPDGTGKSTFIDALSKALSYYYVSDESKSHVYHFRPNILPNLGAIGEKSGLRKEDKNFTNPHRAKAAGKVSSFFRMVYYWSDYCIGVPLNLIKDSSHDKFSIYDRYMYDFLVDPRRSRIDLPLWLRKLFTNLVIQPDLVFVLLTDAETIYKRKQELSVFEINRQLDVFKRLSKSNKRFVIIDAAQSLEVMVDQAIVKILKTYTNTSV